MKDWKKQNNIRYRVYLNHAFLLHNLFLYQVLARGQSDVFFVPALDPPGAVVSTSIF
jgi:hypothetical protein